MSTIQHKLTRTIDTPRGLAEVVRIFGDPRSSDGTLNKSWEEDNICHVAPPPQWRLFFQDEKTEIAEVAGIRMHRLVADLFLAALRDLFERARNELGNTHNDEAVRQLLHRKRMDQYTEV